MPSPFVDKSKEQSQCNPLVNDWQILLIDKKHKNIIFFPCLFKIIFL